MSTSFNTLLSRDCSTKKLGDTAELLVITYLKTHDFTILERNYRKRFGEIDIVARKKNVIAFIEVKSRKKEYFPLSEVITFSKQKKIIKTAKAFILEHTMHNVLYRFDLALLSYDVNTENQKLTYIENAFTDEAYY